jgi:hypothetical protein
VLVDTANGGIDVLATGVDEGPVSPSPDRQRIAVLTLAPEAYPRLVDGSGRERRSLRFLASRSGRSRSVRPRPSTLCLIRCAGRVMGRVSLCWRERTIRPVGGPW